MQKLDEKFTPLAQHCMTLYVQIGALNELGELPHGTGKMIPITGGTFEGKFGDVDFQGDVMAGGADWQLIRSDGVTELRAHYAVKSDTGEIIQVHNHMLVRRNSNKSGPKIYAKGHIKFEAPVGKFEFLNRSIFVSTVNTPPDDQAPVTIRVFEIS